MTSKSPSAHGLSVAEQAREHDRRFLQAFTQVQDARKRLVKVRPHRALTPLNVTPWLLAQAIVLPILLCALLLWGETALHSFWRQCVMFWAPGLGLPFSISPVANEAGHFFLRFEGGITGVGSDGGPMPGTVTLVVTAVLTVLALAGSFFMRNERFPLRYPLRIVGVLQLVTLVYFWASPETFPYTIARHSEELMTIGYVVMVATPVMLAAGYYILNHSLVVKLLNTALILGFFAVMVPHQMLVQALLMQHVSVLFMPVLYICMGAVFDALVFVALYSWVVSNTPRDATL
ncbi:MAG: hypothetical protein EOO28_17730 [Comamonadaceae bacterium]|nr:MAG: hypothetical protein EOO28_17730 [Comamonadaceae bacterium]